MKQIRTLWIVGLLTFWSSFVGAAQWRVGIARTEITPTESLRMAGFAGRKHPAEGMIHPLWAKALVIEDRRAQRAVIVTTDLIGDNCERNVADAVGARVARRTGIERERIVLNFSHTHCGPVVHATDGAMVTYDQRLTEVLLKRIAERGAIETAYPCPVQVVRFGKDLSLVALSGETVVDCALRLRKQFTGERIWVAGYCNEVFAYVPSERVLAEGGYEGGGAMKYFGWHGPFKPGVEDRVVGLVDKLMERCRHAAH